MSIVNIKGGKPWKTFFKSEHNGDHITYNFGVLINGKKIGGFNAMEGLSRTIETQKYFEGGRTHSPRLLVGNGEWSNVTLSGGYLDHSYLLDWIASVNETLKPVDGRKIKGASKSSFRREVTIVHFSRDYRPVRAYHLHRAFPVNWTAASLDASASESPNESIELAYESMFHQVVSKR